MAKKATKRAHIDDAKFRQFAVRIMTDLARDIPEWGGDELNLAAPPGNFGVESAGFTIMQEIKPTVAGSRGGYGWAQWTGPRRRAFEAWAKARDLHVDDYEANYGFLIHELRTTEKAAIRAVAEAPTLDAKVKAFMLKYERPGIPHLAERQMWARIAVAVYEPPANDASERPLGDTNPIVVREAQERLDKLGYTPGGIDGKMGPLTTAAVSKFQKVNEIQVTGQLDEGTLKLLRSGDAKPMEVAPEREKMPEPEVRNRFYEVWALFVNKMWAYVVGVFGFITTALNGVIENIPGAQAWIDKISPYFAWVKPWQWGLALILVGLVLWRISQRGEQTATTAVREARRL